MLTFENTGSLGTNYFVDVRHLEAQADAVVAACKTLKKG